MKRSPGPVSSAISMVFAILCLTVVASAGSAASPITKGPWVQHVSATSAIVRVEVDPPSPVTFELASGPSRAAVESREPRPLHSFVLTNLEPATRYTFAVRARGAQKYGVIATAPLDGPFRFLAYGDNRSDDAAHAAVVRAMAAVPSSFLVHTGDFVEHGASAANWQTFFEIEAPLLRERCLFASVGNHELVDGAGVEFVRYFSPAPSGIPPASSDGGAPLALPLDVASRPLALEQLSGTYRWSNTRFFLLNGMVEYATGLTREWLERALGDADMEPGLVWRIVVTHHGPWSSGPHGGNAHFRDAKIPELLRAHKVDLVLSGHDHLYDRGLGDGLPYVVTGGGGAPVYPIKKVEPSSLHREAAHHFLDASVNATEIQLRAIRADGSMIERCTLRKAAGWHCNGVVGSDAALESGAGQASALPPEAPGVSRSRCGCHIIGAAGEGGPAGSLVVLGVLVVHRRRRRREASS